MLPSSLTSLRLNFLIILVFPIVALGSVKVLNYFLPKSFYFSVSSLVKGNDEPFIVEPPSVTGSRLCELLRRYGIDPQNSGGQIARYTRCNEEFVEQNNPTRFKITPIAVSKDTKDLVYRRAFQSDGIALKSLNADVSRFVRPMSDHELHQLIAGSASVYAAFRKMYSYYTGLFSNSANEGNLHQLIEQTYQGVIPPIVTQDVGEENEVGTADNSGNLNQEEVRQIDAAHERFAKAFFGIDYSTSNGINASEIDKILAGLTYPGQLSNDIFEFYKTKLTSALDNNLRSSFTAQGLHLLQEGEERNAVITDIYIDTFWRYLLSALIRIAPIFLLALGYGLYYGRIEINSISFGGAIAAFLLVWPIILLWDNVVQSKWQEYKALFIALYVAYIITFALIARTGALIVIAHPYR